MLSIIKALIRMAKNLQRIREILEIVHDKELSYHNLQKQYITKTSKQKDSEREFYYKPPTTDIFGEEIEEDLE